MLTKTVRSVCVLGAAIAAVAIGQSANAAAITAGDVVVYRVGTPGGATLGTTTASVFLDEYSPTGSLVQSIAMPSTGASELTTIGNSTSEGIVSPSQDGRLVFTGYRLDAGTASPSGSSTATRVIGTLKADGTFDTSVGLTGITGNIRSATTTNGSTYYVSTSALIGYVGTPGASSTVTSIDARNSRQVTLASIGANPNSLVASNGSTAVTAKVQSYGNAPTGTTVGTPIVTRASADAVNGIYFVDLSPSVAGVDTLYVLSTVESQLQKYSFDGTAWTLTGAVSSGATNLTAGSDGTNVSIYLTTGSSLQRINDTSGYNGTLAGSITTIATAATGTGFRGLGNFNAAFTAVPEPMTLGALALAGTLVGRRRK